MKDSDIKNLKERIIKLLIPLAMLVIIAIMSSVAWFTYNKSVDINDWGMSAPEGNFDLASIGGAGNSDSYIKNILDGEGFSKFLTEDGEVQKSGTYTTTEKNKIKWCMSAESNTNNYYTKEENNESYALAPGAYGKLEFYVIPHSDGNMNLTYTFNMNCFGQEEKSGKLPEDTSSYIVSGNNYIPQVKYSNLDKDEAYYSRQYLSNHIIFFTERNEIDINKDDVADYYTYSGYLPVTFNESGNIWSVSFSEAHQYSLDAETGKGKAHKVTLYWVWPYIAGQIVLPAGDARFIETYQKIFSNLNEESIFLENMLSNKENFFNFSNVEFIDGVMKITGEISKDEKNIVTKENISMMKNGSGYNADFDSGIYSDFSLYWNNADNSISTNIGYMTVELSVTGG